MNCNYPKTSADYDEEFLFLAIKGIFPKNEIVETSIEKKLTSLNREKLAFLKGSFHKSFKSVRIRLEKLTDDHYFPALFYERVKCTGNDVERIRVLRRKILNAINRLAEKAENFE